ncbi:MAG: o-succinylbenzoate synthase [Fluviicola sp.]|jgi:o-succinylbenzoate synthase
MRIIESLPEGDFSLSFEAHTLYFKQPSGTSRGVLTEKKLWLLTLKFASNETKGIGECSVIPGLSPDFISVYEYEKKLTEVCQNPRCFLENPSLLNDFPSVLFGLESAYLDWKNGGKQTYFDTAFNTGKVKIPINGLIWMGDKSFMEKQIEEKLAQGFRCLKMKVGAIDFESEVDLLKSIRNRFPSNELELRVDANGAFSLDQAFNKLERLSQFEIHSIEQPIKAGNWNEMAELCVKTPIPIALDEELIGVNSIENKILLLETIKPQYIILKPSLHGGFSGSKEWISLAEEKNIPWWMTSALESNIGLTAIAQFASTFTNDLPQGLGTGSLYTSNFESNLCVENGFIFVR